MGRIIRAVILLVVLGFVALVAYAYLGPLLGADFSAPRQEMREKVMLDGP